MNRLKINDPSYLNDFHKQVTEKIFGNYDFSMP